MADSQTNIHTSPGFAGANANIAARFNSPITFVQMGVWALLATLFAAGIWTLPERETSMPVAIAPITAPSPPLLLVSRMQTGSIEPEITSPGITVLKRSSARASAPVAAGADKANGFAISLGDAQKFSTLSKRFERIAALNTVMFQNLEPRAIFIDTASGLSARLLAGPFKSKKEAAITCGIMRLPDGIICETQTFDGELISRQ